MQHDHCATIEPQVLTRRWATAHREWQLNVACTSHSRVPSISILCTSTCMQWLLLVPDQVLCITMHMACQAHPQSTTQTVSHQFNMCCAAGSLTFKVEPESKTQIRVPAVQWMYIVPPARSSCLENSSTICTDRQQVSVKQNARMASSQSLDQTQYLLLCLHPQMIQWGPHQATPWCNEQT